MRHLIPVLLAGVLLAGTTRTAEPQSDPQPLAEPLDSAWTRAVPGVEGLALSPEGDRVVTLGGGQVRSFSADGRVLWELRIPDVDSAAVARRGSLTVAFARRRPLARKVYFLNADGRRAGILEPSEPVEDAAVFPDGRTAVLAAGRSVILCRLTGKGVTHQVLPLEGQPHQVLPGPGENVYVSCRQPAYVALLKSNGKPLWRREQPGVDEYALSVSRDGRSAALAAELPAGTVQTWLVTSRNVVRWTDVRPGRRPQIRLSAGGNAVALSYMLRVEGPRGARFERRLTYLAAGAGGAWPKGGPFSAPLHLAIEPEGDWVVALDTQRRGGPPRFRLYGRSGERRWLHTGGQGVRLARACQEGEAIAIYRTDGFLELLRVSAS